ncbi:unnamed protein product [Mesocestoides corti]|uniref:Peptidase S41 n=1 Tax=Mesocestoides corti TaxID=53468 RepID=A0A0R3U6Q7_MESCO|nr:unnamed protein product [Mesocestoides corti]
MHRILLISFCVTTPFARANDDPLSENSRDPPSLPLFLRQTYKTMSEFAFDFERYPYDHEFTKRIFTEGTPSLYEFLAIFL